MSKFARIFAFILCGVMMFSLLVSCGKDDIDKAKDYLEEHPRDPEEPYVTLNMYIPCRFDPTIKEASDTINEMQKEFNQIIEPKYRTRIVFKFVNEADYDKAIADQAALALSKIDTDLSNTPSSPLDPFPQLEEFQMDIFVATGLDMVKMFSGQTLTAKEQTDLQNKLGVTSDKWENYKNDVTGLLGTTKQFTSGVIATSYMTALLDTTYYSKFCKETGTTSLPSVLFNNAVYHHDLTDFDGNRIDKNGVVIPATDKTTEVKQVYTRFGVPANFLIGDYEYCFVKRSAADELYFSTMTGTPQSRIETLEDNIDAANAELGTVKYVKSEIIRYGNGTSELLGNEDYYQLVMKNPQLTTADIYKGMFCIASTCRNEMKALNIIDELYNNKALHSILQYGAKEITYRLVVNEAGRTEAVPVEGGPAYSIDPRYTGNIAMLYECNDAELSGGVALTYEYLNRVYTQNKDAEFK